MNESNRVSSSFTTTYKEQGRFTQIVKLVQSQTGQEQHLLILIHRSRLTRSSSPLCSLTKQTKKKHEYPGPPGLHVSKILTCFSSPTLNERCRRLQLQFSAMPADLSASPEQRSPPPAADRITEINDAFSKSLVATHWPRKQRLYFLSFHSSRWSLS